MAARRAKETDRLTDKTVAFQFWITARSRRRRRRRSPERCGQPADCRLSLDGAARWPAAAYVRACMRACIAYSTGYVHSIVYSIGAALRMSRAGGRTGRDKKRGEESQGDTTAAPATAPSSIRPRKRSGGGRSRPRRGYRPASDRRGIP